MCMTTSALQQIYECTKAHTAAHTRKEYVTYRWSNRWSIVAGLSTRCRGYCSSKWNRTCGKVTLDRKSAEWAPGLLPATRTSQQRNGVCPETHTHTHKHTHSLTHSLTNTYTHTHIGILIKWSEQGSSPYKFVAIICLIQSVKHIISVSQLLTLKIIFGLQLLNSKVLTMAPLKLVSKQSWQQDILSISNKFLCY